VRGFPIQGFWVTVPQISASFVYSSVYEKLRRVLNVHTGISSPAVVSALAGIFHHTSTTLFPLSHNHTQ